MVVEGGGETTYAELAGAAEAVHARLAAAGVAPGDRVALRLPNGPGYVAAYFGTLRAGAIAVPLNPLLARPEVEERLTASGAEIVLDDDALPVPASEPAPAECAPDEAAVILFTSGTTGRAKGAILTHAGLRLAAANIARVLAYSADDVILGAAPFTHVLGQSGGMNAAILAGARIAVPGRFDPPRTLAEMTRTGTTVLLGVPTMCVGLTAAAGETGLRPPLRVAHIGGAPMPEEVRIAFESAFACPVHEGYGLTELSGMAAAQPVGVPRVAGTVGVAVGGEMRLVAAGGAVCGPDELGEVRFRGGTVIPGYWDDPAATEAAFDADGWLRTGDLGRMDAGGNLTLVDRTKDVIIRGGYNVYPREVEEALYRHPDVREASVVGLPDPALGEEVAAFVVLRAGAQPDPDGLRAFAAGQVAAYKYPRRIVYCETLPKSPTGKVLKRELVRSHVASRTDET